MEILFWIFIFIISLVVLIKAADYFTDSAEKIGRTLGLSSFIVGATIVGIGTSLPELATGIVAVLKGGEAIPIVAANVIGSNITNILFIIGIGSVIGGALKVSKDLVKLDLPLLSLSAALFVLLVAWDGTLSFFDAVLSLGAFGVYVLYVLRGRADKAQNKKQKGSLKRREFVKLLLGGAFLYLGANYAVESILALGGLFSIKPALISLTALALGTSLPELSVTLSAVKRKRYEIAIGNIFGSNIINLLLVVAIPALITPLIIEPQVLLIGIPFLITATLLYVVVSLDKTVHSYEGAMLLLIYAAYLFIIGTNLL